MKDNSINQIIPVPKQIINGLNQKINADCFALAAELSLSHQSSYNLFLHLSLAFLLINYGKLFHVVDADAPFVQLCWLSCNTSQFYKTDDKQNIHHQ